MLQLHAAHVREPRRARDPCEPLVGEVGVAEIELRDRERRSGERAGVCIGHRDVADRERAQSAKLAREDRGERVERPLTLEVAHIQIIVVLPPDRPHDHGGHQPRGGVCQDLREQRRRARMVRQLERGDEAVPPFGRDARGNRATPRRLLVLRQRPRPAHELSAPIAVLEEPVSVDGPRSEIIWVRAQVSFELVHVQSLRDLGHASWQPSANRSSCVRVGGHSRHMTRLALLALALAACTTHESSDVLTSGIYASISAQSTGNGKTDVRATLYVGNPIGLNFVELTGDDKLLVKSAGMTKEMRETQLLNTVAHQAEFATDAEGAQFEVVFDRTIDDGAPSSIATLPAKFEVTVAPQTASRAQAIAFEWMPAGTADAMSWTATGDCIELESAPMTDTGTATIPADALKKRMGTNIPDTCAVTVTVFRSRAGMLDPHYGKGGEVRGIQARTMTFTSTP